MVDGRLLSGSRNSQIARERATTLGGLRKQLELLTIEASRQVQSVEQAEEPPSLHEFIQEAWPVLEPKTSFVDGRHIQAICEHLEAVFYGDILRLLINMPPRFMKSTIVSVMWPVWCWIQQPSIRWLCSSYALSLAIRDNRRCRQLIQSNWFQLKYGSIFQFSGDQNVKGRFENTAMGTRLAVSTLSSATGEGGDYLLCDDPHAIDDKESETAREATRDWWNTTWSTRLNDPQTSRMVCVGQRIHFDDISGMLIEQGGWECLILQAEFEPERACSTRIWQDWRTHEGELLWPERFPQEVLDEQKRKLGSFGYASIYQQSPVPATGGTFQQAWARYFEIKGDHYVLHTKYGHHKPVPIRACRNEAVCDLAVSEREQSDFFIIQTWAITPENECLLLHQLRGHFTNPDQQKKAVELYERFAWMVFWIENVAYQLAYVQQLRNYELEEEVSPGLYRKRVVSIPVRPWRPFRDKVARAGVAAVKMEAGDMYFMLGAPYLTESSLRSSSSQSRRKKTKSMD